MIDESTFRNKKQNELERQNLNQYPFHCKLLDTLSDGTQVYSLGSWLHKCSVVLSQEHGLWHLSVSGKKRKPSPRQLFIAKAELLPLDVEMVERKGLGFDPFCVHLFQVEGTLHDAIDWLEKRGYQREFDFENDSNNGWRKGRSFVLYSLLPDDKKPFSLRDFKAAVIDVEKQSASSE